jgi:hypothetical protein
MIQGTVAFGPRVISYKSQTPACTPDHSTKREVDMAVNSSATEPGTFDESLVACVADINELLPPLGRRYDMTVIISALAEHVGSALKVLMLRNICDVRQVRQVIKNIEQSAFAPKTTQTETQESEDSTGTDTPEPKEPTR